MTPSSTERPSARAKGLGRFIVGAGLSVAVILFFQWLERQGYKVDSFGVAWALPGVWAIMGIAEMLTGNDFRDIAKRWDSMAPWKQTVYGFLLMGLGFGLICGVIATIILFSD